VRQPSAKSRNGNAKDSLSRVLYIEPMILMEILRKNIIASARDAKFALETLYVIKYESMVRDDRTDEVIECTAPMIPNPQTRRRRRTQGAGRYSLGFAQQSVPAEVRLYDRLFILRIREAKGKISLII